MFAFLRRLFGTAQERKVRSFSKIVTQIRNWEKTLSSLSPAEIQAKTAEFRSRIAKGETTDALLPEAYAVVVLACKHMCGTPVHVSGYEQKWDMVPYDVQLVGGIAMHQGCIAEMRTGEGKTLTAALPLYLNALTGKPVHLVTTNDYLAERDCQWVGGILRYLGLTTGFLKNDLPTEERKEVYASDVVYGTASEFGFDYLRDNSMSQTAAEQVQRGHYFSMIDEVDSILIDEARTPLIISGPSAVSRQMYDLLKEDVFALVKLQREACNKIATQAKAILDKNTHTDGTIPLQKNTACQEAIRMLWLVGKGTPHNKILKRAKENPDLRAALDQCDLYYYNDQNKEERQQALATLYILIDERSSEFELTEKGIHAWSETSGGKNTVEDFIMLDLGEAFAIIDANPDFTEEQKVQARLEIQEEDSHRKERSHNLRQLFRAHLLMEKDIDYMVQEGKIVIIDENTGRPQPGRRFSDGLHQAIEAKEGVAIQRETQTYATVTLQNYFRLYTKLAGMTGTASTEAQEFKDIYKLEVLAIPTHRPCIRADANDEIYMTEREKYLAILKDIRHVHEAGRPILIGTESVEISEKLSRILTQNALPHTVLNAKNPTQEAEIVSNAGMKSAITVSTNMAGRGTDIKLGEGIAELGGLYVLGTTRHQSRRIDLQLRGRCARQGDPGSSKFYVSFEDTLLRLFASPMMTTLIQKMRPPEGEPISAPMLNSALATAQQRVEQRNAAMRKHTLEYDDVMNRQRQEIYQFRNEILSTPDIMQLSTEILEAACLKSAEEHVSHPGDERWQPEAFRQFLLHHFPVSFEEGFFDEPQLDVEPLAQKASDPIKALFVQKCERDSAKIREQQPTIDPQMVLSHVLRRLMLRKVDRYWQEHLLAMDHLRSDVNLRAIGQRDPLMEFKHEAFRLFEDLSTTLRSEIAHDLFLVDIQNIFPPQQQPPQQPVTPPLRKLLESLPANPARLFLDLSQTMAQPFKPQGA